MKHRKNKKNLLKRLSQWVINNLSMTSLYMQLFLILIYLNNKEITNDNEKIIGKMSYRQDMYITWTYVKEHFVESSRYEKYTLLKRLNILSGDYCVDTITFKNLNVVISSGSMLQNIQHLTTLFKTGI